MTGWPAPAFEGDPGDDNGRAAPLPPPRPPCRLPSAPLPFSLPLRVHPPTAFSASSPARAEALLPRAVARGVAFVPGAPFFAGAAQAHTLRLSFVTATLEEIERGCVALGRTFAEAITG